ncbi:hypothetical protein DPEC_G00362010 [Dallia pectoralis]|nr:hypothetical protein DPEC_G00362010 [Dallia pectoralis]
MAVCRHPSVILQSVYNVIFDMRTLYIRDSSFYCDRGNATGVSGQSSDLPPPGHSNRPYLRHVLFSPQSGEMRVIGSPGSTYQRLSHLRSPTACRGLAAVAGI